jgi:hypothetical protein
MDANDEIFKRIFDYTDFRTLLADYVLKVYEQLHHETPGHSETVSG